jgi:hypothetical protein
LYPEPGFFIEQGSNPDQPVIKKNDNMVKEGHQFLVGIPIKN